MDIASDRTSSSEAGLEVDDDVEIRFIGLRPGEKLFEELHSDNENRKETAHPKIMVAECEVNDLFAVSRAIDHLAAAAERPRETIVAELQDVVPTYHPDAAPVVRRKAA